MKNVKIVILFMLLSSVFISCGPSLAGAHDRYKKGVKAYLDDSYENGTDAFNSSIDQGYLVPGVYASLGVMQIKEGTMTENYNSIESGIKLLEKEYELYKDPLILDYINFLKERFNLKKEETASGGSLK